MNKCQQIELGADDESFCRTLLRFSNHFHSVPADRVLCCESSYCIVQFQFDAEIILCNILFYFIFVVEKKKKADWMEAIWSLVSHWDWQCTR